MPIQAGLSRADGDEIEGRIYGVTIPPHAESAVAGGIAEDCHKGVRGVGGGRHRRCGRERRGECDEVVTGVGAGRLKTGSRGNSSIRVDRAANDAQILFAARRKVLAAGTQLDVAADVQLGSRRRRPDADVAVGVAVTAESTCGQNPPRTVKAPALEVPASGWPIVPPTRCVPPVLNVAPPPSMVLRVRS